MVRKALPPEEIKREKKRKSKILFLAAGQVTLFILLFTLSILCVLKWGVKGEVNKMGLTLPNFCLPWWWMFIAIVVSFVGVGVLVKGVNVKYPLKYVMLVLFILSAVMFYLGLFYLTSLFCVGGVVCACILVEQTSLKQKVSFLPIFVLLCYLNLVLYFFALLN